MTQPRNLPAREVTGLPQERRQQTRHTPQQSTAHRLRNPPQHISSLDKNYAAAHDASIAQLIAGGRNIPGGPLSSRGQHQYQPSISQSTRSPVTHAQTSVSSGAQRGTNPTTPGRPWRPVDSTTKNVLQEMRVAATLTVDGRRSPERPTSAAETAMPVYRPPTAASAQPNLPPASTPSPTSQRFPPSRPPSARRGSASHYIQKGYIADVHPITEEDEASSRNASPRPVDRYEIRQKSVAASRWDQERYNSGDESPVEPAVFRFASQRQKPPQASVQQQQRATSLSTAPVPSAPTSTTSRTAVGSPGETLTSRRYGYGSSGLAKVINTARNNMPSIMNNTQSKATDNVATLPSSTNAKDFASAKTTAAIAESPVDSTMSQGWKNAMVRGDVRSVRSSTVSNVSGSWVTTNASTVVGSAVADNPGELDLSYYEDGGNPVRDKMSTRDVNDQHIARKDFAEPANHKAPVATAVATNTLSPDSKRLSAQPNRKHRSWLGRAMSQRSASPAEPASQKDEKPATSPVDPVQSSNLQIPANNTPGARTSVTPLPDLIRRATRLASNLDRGRTASRLSMMNWMDWAAKDAAAGGSDSGAAVKSTDALDEKAKVDHAPGEAKSRGSLSDMIASFPAPSPGREVKTTPRAQPSGNQKRNFSFREITAKWPAVSPHHSQILYSTEHLPYTEANSPTKESFEKKNTNVSRKQRKCCGLSLWLFMLLLGLSILLLAAAVILPITLIVLPHQQMQQNSANSSATGDAAVLEQCTKPLPCQNAGVNIRGSDSNGTSSAESSCVCLCVNGYTGTLCAAPPPAETPGCSVWSFNGLNNVTIGAMLPPVVQAAPATIGIPLSPARLSSVLARVGLSCTGQNALVRFLGVAGGNTRRSELSALDDAEDNTIAARQATTTATPTASAVVTTSNGVVYLTSATASATVPSQAVATSTPSAPSNTTYSTTAELLFARAAVLYLLQNTSSLDVATMAQVQLQNYFNSTMQSGGEIALGDGWRANVVDLVLWDAAGKEVA